MQTPNNHDVRLDPGANPPAVSHDQPSLGFALLGFFLPLVSLILMNVSCLLDGKVPQGRAEASGLQPVAATSPA